MPKPTKRFAKIYTEITNVCNMNCDFCRGTKRRGEFMNADDFKIIAKKISPYTSHVYLHVMGEPLLHPDLEKIIDAAHEEGLLVCITTNGTLLKGALPMLLKNAEKLYKISISLHSHEANGKDFSKEYIENCISSAMALGEAGVISVLRLWNLEGQTETAPKNNSNSEIISLLRKEFKGEWTENRSGKKLGKGVYLEWGEKFDWPDYSGKNYGNNGFCYALKDHFAILVDGTVIPCCLDGDGQIPLGNIFSEDVDEILSNETALFMLDCFKNYRLNHPLCSHCGFAQRFK